MIQEEDWDRRVHRYLEGDLEEEEARTLNERVKTDAKARYRLAQMAYDQAQVMEIVGAAVPEAKEPRGAFLGRATGWSLTLAAALLLLGWVGFVLWSPPPQPPGVALKQTDEKRKSFAKAAENPASAKKSVDVTPKAHGKKAKESGFRQWAVGANASSEYSNPAWSAQQATGEPDTFQGGDLQTAWASKQQDAGEEWLELTYEHSVRPTCVRVAETYNPGAVVKIEGQDSGGKWRVLWEGKDTNQECPGWFTVEMKPSSFATRTIKITIDSAGVPGWNEIDAVELVGEKDETPPKKDK